MKFCQLHWDELKAAIDERGLSHLIAKDGRGAVNRVVAEIEGTATDASYDPLMAAYWMITGRALEMGGLYLMTGDYCPLCELEKHTEHGVAAEWIQGCTDSVKVYCEEKGLVRLN